MPLRIHFVLPGLPTAPNGGSKIVYRYANELTQRGQFVSVYHQMTYWNISDPLRWLKWSFKAWKANRNARLVTEWAKIDPGVQIKVVPGISDRHLLPADVTIATAWCTANSVANLSPRIKGSGFYLLQHLEDWDIPRNETLATWKLPLRKIVIAKWLEEIAISIGEESTYIPNGLDFEEFGVDASPADRNTRRIGMLWHDLKWKGSQDGLKALEMVKKQVPSLTAEFYGTSPRPDSLPKWIDYTQQPSRKALRALYNRCSIFLAPSHTEGWGLPPCEAMQCGCAVVASDIGGHREFAIPGENALLVPPGATEIFAQVLHQLINDDSLRLKLATNAQESIRQFTWNQATNSLLETIRVHIQSH